MLQHMAHTNNHSYLI